MAHAPTLPAAKTPFYRSLYAQVLMGIVLAIHRRKLLSRLRRRHEAVGRRVHQAHQNDDRVGGVLHRGVRHLLHGQHEKGGPRRRQGAAVFRDRIHLRAVPGHGGGQHPATGRRLQRGPGQARYQGHRAICRRRAAPEHARLPAQHHSKHLYRRLRQGRHPAGGAGVHPVRLRPVRAGGGVRRPCARPSTAPPAWCSPWSTC